MPASEEMKSIFRRQPIFVMPLWSGLCGSPPSASGVFYNAPLRAVSDPTLPENFEPNCAAGSVRVYARRNPVSGVVDAGGNPVAAIGFHGRAAAAESCEE